MESLYGLKLTVFTARKRSLGQGNVFTPVCHSVHSGNRSGRYASYRNACLFHSSVERTFLENKIYLLEQHTYNSFTMEHCD